MKQFAIFLLSIILFSCNEKKSQDKNTEIKDTTKSQTYIEKYIQEQFQWDPIDPAKGGKEAFGSVICTDSMHFRSLDCTIYDIHYDGTYDVNSYHIIRDNKTNNFYRLIYLSGGHENASLSIDQAYEILSNKNIIVEPVDFEFQGLENFINQSENRKRKLKNYDLDSIFTTYFKYTKISSGKELDSAIKERFEFIEYAFKRHYKSKYTKELISLLTQTLADDRVSIYVQSYNRGILFVQIIPGNIGDYNIRILNIL